MWILSLLLWTIMVAAAASPGRAATAPSCIGVSVERTEELMGQPTAFARVENGCAELFQVVHIECKWLTGEDELASGSAEVLNLEPEQNGMAQIINWSQPEGFDDVQCQAVKTVISKR